MTDDRLSQIRERLSKAAPTHVATFDDKDLGTVTLYQHTAYSSKKELLTHAEADLTYLLAKLEIYEKALTAIRNERKFFGTCPCIAKEALKQAEELK